MSDSSNESSRITIPALHPFPVDGPVEILSLLARRLQLRISSRQIRQLVDAHKYPRSLPALIEAGRNLGLKLELGKATADLLDEEADEFVILHFRRGDTIAFALLDGKEGSRFR